MSRKRKKLPNPVYITDHAKERIMERIGAKEEKHQRLAEKAWAKGCDVPNSIKHRAAIYKTGTFYKANRVCKELMGYVFIFVPEKQKVLLVTVL